MVVWAITHYYLLKNNLFAVIYHYIAALTMYTILSLYTSPYKEVRSNVYINSIAVVVDAWMSKFINSLLSSWNFSC